MGPSTSSPSPADQEQSVVARQTEAKVEAERTAHLGDQATTQRRHALARLREITDPYR